MKNIYRGGLLRNRPYKSICRGGRCFKPPLQIAPSIYVAARPSLTFG